MAESMPATPSLGVAIEPTTGAVPRLHRGGETTEEWSGVANPPING